jgi:hypothetical protein
MMPEQSEGESPMEATTAPAVRAQRRTTAKPAIRKSADRTKATIVMPTSVDFRLGAVAAHLQLDRSALAAKLIDEGLRRYSLDTVLRQFADRQTSTDGVSQVDTAA